MADTTNKKTDTKKKPAKKSAGKRFVEGYKRSRADTLARDKPKSGKSDSDEEKSTPTPVPKAETTPDKKKSPPKKPETPKKATKRASKPLTGSQSGLKSQSSKKLGSIFAKPKKKKKN